jgi:Fe-Mn family superoxide dismutase
MARTDGGRGSRAGCAGRRVYAARVHPAPLDYPYDALEPHIDAATMQLHHSKHHDGYVKGLNKALAAMANIRQSGNADQYAQIRDLTDQLSFHGSGHALHTVFWKNMKPGGGGQPSGALAAAIDRDFGSFSASGSTSTRSPRAVHGSGWGILGVRAALRTTL